MTYAEIERKKTLAQIWDIFNKTFPARTADTRLAFYCGAGFVLHMIPIPFNDEASQRKHARANADLIKEFLAYLHAHEQKRGILP